MRQVSNTRFTQFLSQSIKYFSWDIILRDAGITEISDKGDQYEIKCILHEDAVPSLRLTKHNGVYHCFSCGCSGTYTKFLWELSGRAIPYSAYCEQILKANPSLQADLGFTSLYVTEKTLDPAFQSRRVFDLRSHLGSGMPMTVLSEKVRKMGDTWENLVLSLTLLQQDVAPEGVLAILEKQYIEIEEPATRVSLMDLLED